MKKNNRWPEAFEHRQKVLDAIVSLEKNENNPELYTADFFEFYIKLACTAAKLGKKDLAQKYIEKAESLNFQIEKASSEVQNSAANNFVTFGDALIDVGNKEKAKDWYSKAIESWQNLQKAGKFYPVQSQNLAAAIEKLKK